jgi:hypothetical protein
METVAATAAAPGRPNEDYVLVAPSWAIVLDGATPLPSFPSGCVHGVPWLVRQLATALATQLADDPAIPLTDAVFAAIKFTCQAHSHTCDLANPSSPSSTVSIMRQADDHVDWLVLADSPILADVDGTLQVITDERSARLPSYEPESIRHHRNQAEGFWVASTQPEAAYRALSGAIPVAGLSSASMITDGLARYVERFHLGTWEDLHDGLQRHGFPEVVTAVRLAELSLPEVSHEPNGRTLKRHDDATAAIIRFDPEGSEVADGHTEGLGTKRS